LVHGLGKEDGELLILLVRNDELESFKKEIEFWLFFERV